MAGMAAAFAPLVAESLAARTVPIGGGRHTVVERVPHGVVGAIIPFNWPVSVLGNKVLPALLAGNAVVVKPPPTCPGAMLEVAAALAAALPPGLLNVVNGPDVSLGQALVTHPGIDMVTFTGGVPAGRAVMAAAAATTKPVVLELGGNDPAIIAPDVEIDAALADRMVAAAFTTSGQVCMAIKRVYVPEDRRSALVEALVERLSAEVVGDGLSDEVTMGPVHTASARDRAEEMVAEAAAAGARIHRPATVREEDAGSGGYLVSPAIVEEPPVDARIVVDEQFAPVLPVIGYRQLDDAVGWPTPRPSASARRSGPTTASSPRRCPAASKPARSSSTTTAWGPWTTWPRSGDGRRPGSGPSSAPKAWPTSPGPASSGACPIRRRDPVTSPSRPGAPAPQGMKLATHERAARRETPCTTW